jgi:methionyl-tRNA synthetase
MVGKYRDGLVPDAPGTGLDQAIGETFASARHAMEQYKVHEALSASIDLARAANGYVEDRQPWALAKDPEGGAELDETLATLWRTLVCLCALFEPVAPSKMAALATRLGLEGVPTLDQAPACRGGGRTVLKAEPLFPKIDPSWRD